MEVNCDHHRNQNISLMRKLSKRWLSTANLFGKLEFPKHKTDLHTNLFITWSILVSRIPLKIPNQVIDLNMFEKFNISN